MAIPEIPLSRTEQYLNKIATGDGIIPDIPLTRIEQYLNRIATKEGAIPEMPLSRSEHYLTKIIGEDAAIPEVPITRIEQYLAKIAGQESTVPEVPLSRTEQYLAEIAENGGQKFDPILFDNGKISQSIGGFNFTGYKYNISRFTQEIKADSLYVHSTDPYNYHGGRTFTTELPIPDEVIGKTLYVSGYMENTAPFGGGRSYVCAVISDYVTDDSETESVSQSTAFQNRIIKSEYIDSIASGASSNFTISLPVTKSGYVSVVSYKAYSGVNDVYFKKIWIE